ncbi:TadE/TadG family type IV pilus assembly protein [Yoonia sp.]|uniref:TadE/TadG family type IV pilus assembly protein n=1 Tax=Yoonia sp. TaxID=2212373 RepID=UPI0039191F50
MKKVTNFLARFCRDESGTSTVEFVILAPVMFTFLFMGVELGVTMTRQVLLDRGVDVSIRALRLGHIQNPTVDLLRENICATTSMIRDCERNLLIDLRRVSMTTWNYPTGQTECINRDEEIDPTTQVTSGGSNDLMILRACLIIDPLFPTSRLGLRLPPAPGGGYELFSVTSFVNEPR